MVILLLIHVAGGICIKADAARIGILASDNSQSGTRAFWYRIVPASAFFFIPVPYCFRHLHSFSLRYGTDWMPENSAFRITKTERKVKGGHPARPYCWWWRDTLQIYNTNGRQEYILHVNSIRHGGGTTLTLWCWKIISKCRNAVKKLLGHRHFGR